MNKKSSFEHDTEQHQQVIADIVARKALQHYHVYLPPNKGKPQPGREWTVYSAIVATTDALENQVRNHSLSSSQLEIHDEDDSCWVVSCATGSKCVSLEAAVHSLPTPTSCLPLENTKNSTGTSSTCDSCKRSLRGRVIKDSHAEVLARRGLIRVLWEEILSFLDSYKSHGIQTPQKLLCTTISIDSNGEKKIVFQLKPTLRLHLYISDSPCGDASIYEISSRYSTITSRQNDAIFCNDIVSSQEIQQGDTSESHSVINFTGAKIIVPRRRNDHSPIISSSFSHTIHGTTNSSIVAINRFINAKLDPLCDDDIHIAREMNQPQLLSALRIKSCRSNIPSHLRTKSHCCSDKICRWIILGLQGSGILTSFIPNPIALTSIVVSLDPRCDLEKSSAHETLGRSQLYALVRAFIHRSQICMARHFSSDSTQTMNLNLPTVHIVQDLYPCSKALHEKSKVDKKSLNQLDDSIFCHDVDQSHPLIKKRKRTKTLSQSNPITLEPLSMSPSGLSLNWQITCSSPSRRISTPQQTAIIEVNVGASGMIQGKLPKTYQDVIKLTSRLSRWELWTLALNACDILSQSDLSLSIDGLKSTKEGICITSNDENNERNEFINLHLSYQTWKELFASREARDHRFTVLKSRAGGPLEGWLTSVEEGDFYRTCTSSV